ncbi:hypothetical protein JQC92_20885 [Shewanella sp. 202IG2-18]|uniref:hypothetical protein n=1 Tax=Parashewanella hymeniacidonis TaxID=2807618 RepID=UPI0019619D19|nr:hypothetical protein [Parashewanella hymeniacidonis]MBM7074447.1 hypothetical protein [Parashewanella hymeniacidonis]
MTSNNRFHFNDSLRITDIYHQGSTLHIKASKIWQQRLHNYAPYNSVDLPIIEADEALFFGEDVELIRLMKLLYKNKDLPQSKSVVGDQFAISYSNGDTAIVELDEVLKQLQRCKNTAEALKILKGLI